MIEIKIETNDIPLRHTIKQGAPDGVSVNIPPYKEQRAIGTETIIVIFLNVASIAAPFIVSWPVRLGLVRSKVRWGAGAGIGW